MDWLYFEIINPPNEVLIFSILIKLDTFVLFAEVSEIMHSYELLHSVSNCSNVHVLLDKEVLVFPIDARKSSVEMGWYFC